jgi:hypothetical protein
MDFFLGGFAVEIENSFPQPPIRFDAKERLTPRDETRNVEDRIGRELV